MYQLSIFNNNVETICHYPSQYPDDPHINKLQLTEALSVVDTLSFSLYPNNPGYNSLYELVTRVKAIDLRDNSIRFTGRLLSVSEKMDSSGIVYKEITVEGALSFLNDTKQRANIYTTLDTTTFINQLLSNHNGKVESGKQIQKGNITVTGVVSHTCEFKTTLAELLLVRDTLGGEVSIRESSGVLYLDWLSSVSSNTVDILLGTNMKDMVVGKDITSLGTRIIPLGANNLTISTVNGGYDYIEDATAKGIYGVVERIVEYKDITDATTLRTTCIADLSDYTQPTYVLSSNALDLSYITGVKSDQFALGTILNIVNEIMGIDDVYNIVQMSLDLLTPYNPTLTISNSAVTLTSTITDLRTSAIQNEGVYNNIQIGSTFGIRAVRSDGKVTTTINATDGITIQNNTKKVFSVDLNGDLIINDMTANDITAVGGTYTDITADGGTFDQIEVTGGLVIKDGDTASCTVNDTGIHLIGGNGKEADLEIIDTTDRSGISIPDDLYVGDWLEVGDSCKIANDLWVGGTLRVGSSGYQLNDIIEDKIRDMVLETSLK